MTRQGRQDLIAIVCAFIGASAVRRTVPPVEGLPDIAMSIAGAAIGLMLARAVFKVLNDKEARAALRQAEASKGQNDADFAGALFDDDEGGKV